MPLYRVKPGLEHGAFGQFKAGDVVEHTEAEATGFADKLELVSEPVAPVTPLSPVNVVVVEVPPPFVTAAFDVTGSTVAEVLSAVADGLISVDDAIVTEYAGKKRKTLIEALLEVKNGPAGD